MTMSNFLNPYQFIESKNTDPENHIEAKSIARGEHPFVRHDRWDADARSGRIVCKLTTRTPTAVGGENQESAKGAPRKLQPYLRDGRPAIPGNSLRGVIGTALETLSNSSMRVLEDRQFSVRKSMNDALKMLGRLNRMDGQWRLQPLCATAVSINDRNVIAGFKTLDAVFRDQSDRRLPLRDLLPAYVYPDRLKELRGLPSGAPIKARFSLPEEERATLGGLSRLRRESRLDSRFHVKKRGKKTFVLGQRIEGPIYHLESAPDDAALRIGWFRALDITDDQQRPPTKRYEYVLPEPKEPARTIPVPEEVVERFLALGAARHDADSALPFKLRGQESWRDLDGSLVYFHAKVEHGRPTIEEISLSSIWRMAVPDSVYEQFRRIDPELLPWSEKRQVLTPAECLLGVVGTGAGGGHDILPSLASRVRFRDAVPSAAYGGERDMLMSETKLQILGAPKPPSPAMYFTESDNPERPVNKQDLARRSASIRPNGRKVYLPHEVEGDALKERYVSAAQDGDKSDKQRVRVRPIRPDIPFLFAVEFENLSDEELGLLLSALHPASDSRHRLGIGKPLGLGSVTIDIEAVALWNRNLSDYSAEALERASACTVHAGSVTNVDDLDNEVRLLLSESDRVLADNVQPLSDLRNESLVDDEVLALWKTAMNPVNVEYPVCYPRTAEQFREWRSEGQEAELFSWFVRNDDQRTRTEKLGRIQPGEPLPPLTAHPPPQND
jgi:CRISPR-associated protein (TIGR03986 family)